MIPNQIGLSGDVTPPQYMAQIDERVRVLMEPKTLFSRFGLTIERRWNSRFSHPEYHVTLKYPTERRPVWDPSYDGVVTGKRALLVVFGSVPQLRGGWHARGGPTHYDVVRRPFPKNLGYDNVRNLANY